MFELYKIIFFDVVAYGVNIFLPCLLALIITILHKKDRLKKTWILLLIALPLLICCNLIFFTSYNDSYIVANCIILAVLYAASIAIGLFWGLNKSAIRISIPLIFFCSYFILATYEYIDIRQPFGSVEEYTIPEQAHSDHDYTVRISYSDAWGNDQYAVTIRGKYADDPQNDSIIYCNQYRECASVNVVLEDSIKKDTHIVLATERNACQWELFADEKKETLFKLKGLVEKYRQEYTTSFSLDGYSFGIDVVDYQKRLSRSLKFSNASKDAPKAQEIVNLAFTLIPFKNDNLDVTKACHDRLTEVIAKIKEERAQKDSTINKNDSSTVLVDLKKAQNKKATRRSPKK